jgi:hypothetical protein
VRTIAGNVILVSLHGLKGGSTGNQLMAHLGAVLFVCVVEVLELVVGASLVGVVVCSRNWEVSGAQHLKGKGLAEVNVPNQPMMSV